MTRNPNEESFGRLEDFDTLDSDHVNRNAGNIQQKGSDDFKEASDSEEDDPGYIMVNGRKYVQVEEESEPVDLRNLPDTDRWLGVPPAPRSVSWPAILHLFYKGGLGAFGLVFACFGVAFYIMFMGAGPVHWKTLRYDGADWTPAAGTVRLLESDSAHLTVNGVELFRHRFEWTKEDGTTMEGTCYSNAIVEEEDGLTLECAAGNPNVARLQGTSLSIMSVKAVLFIFFFIAAFPITGLLMTFWSMPRNLRHVRLLREGIAGRAVVQSITETGVRVNDSEYYKIECRFLAEDGQEHVVSFKTLNVDEFGDEPYEILFYDAFRPERAVFLDALPSGIRLVPHEGFTASMLSVIPAIVLSLVFIGEIALIVTSFFSDYTTFQLLGKIFHG